MERRLQAKIASTTASTQSTTATRTMIHFREAAPPALTTASFAVAMSPAAVAPPAVDGRRPPPVPVAQPSFSLAHAGVPVAHARAPFTDAPHADPLLAASGIAAADVPVPL